MLYIFDWDGTLSDSITKIVTSVNDAATYIGLPTKEHLEVQEIVGLGLIEAIEILFPKLSERDAGRLRVRYAETYVRLDQEAPSAFFPYVLDVLEHLHGQGHQLAVATGKSRIGLDRVIAQHGVGELFHTTRCADESGSKPDPAMLMDILSELDMTAEEAVMIGDTEFDLQMAHEINMPRIGVSYGAHSAERLANWKPIACLDQFDQLLAVEFD